MLSEALNESSPSLYSQQLIQTNRKKTITGLSISSLKSPKKITTMLELSIFDFKEDLKSQVKKIFKDEQVFVIWDDTIAPKPYSKCNKDIGRVWDSSTKRAIPGFQVVTCIITNGKIKIPVDCELFFSKKRFGQDKPTKSEIAFAIAMYWKDIVNVERVLADSHYSTKWMLIKLAEKRLPYCMKFAPSRIVKIEGNVGPLKKLLRLTKNNRLKRVAGVYAEIPCFFYVVKYNNSWIYYISNDSIDINKVISTYKRRWKIEEFHRTIKQSLGFNDCQSPSTQKQHRHMFYVIEAYINVELLSIHHGFKNIEDFIKSIRSQNRPYDFQKRAFREEDSAHA